ncbi:hypothetical protein L2E82_24492 [Cichorium intybus]|uniref:Uncharacterized protein n=1 Tax=Cichorium intybus TaxID=13427 RepID=A0ACB9E0J3_CICIN|nr:hypothetical protein L2E82_24492 [Cichorium intybus]
MLRLWWAEIARLLPGRTDNDIKNFWNSKMKKRPLYDNQRHEVSSFSRNHKVSTAMPIYPFSILESSNQHYHHQSSTTFNQSVDIDSSKCLFENPYNSIVANGSFQTKSVMNIHSSIVHNLSQHSNQNQLYTVPPFSCSMPIINEEIEVCYNGHNGWVSPSRSHDHRYSTSQMFSTSSIHGCGGITSKYLNDHSGLIPSMLNQSSISNTSSRSKHGWINSYVSIDHESSLFNTPSIPKSKWTSPSCLDGVNKISSPVFNTSSMPPTSWMSSSLSYDPYQLPSEISIPTYGWMSSSSKNNAQSFSPCRPCNHMDTSSFCQNGKDQTYSSHDPINVDINDFFNFDLFSDNFIEARASKESSFKTQSEIRFLVLNCRDSVFIFESPVPIRSSDFGFEFDY